VETLAWPILATLAIRHPDQARPPGLEARWSVDAFEQGREYNFVAVNPFASRLDEAIDVHGKPLYVVEGGWKVWTKMLVNQRLAEVILYLWNYDRNTFDVQRRREADWISVMEADRAMTSPPTLPDHFVPMMIRTMEGHEIPPPAVGVEQFARWVYESPSRCPGVRLTFETYHRLRRNRTARPRASDIIDLARIPSVPYVDFFVSDRAMMNYGRQAARDIEHPYPALLGNLRGVLSRLGLG
jgi:hypothetical protein